jgi:hypothetical protein
LRSGKRVGDGRIRTLFACMICTKRFTNPRSSRWSTWTAHPLCRKVKTKVPFLVNTRAYFMLLRRCERVWWVKRGYIYPYLRLNLPKSPFVQFSHLSQRKKFLKKSFRLELFPAQFVL